MRNKGKVTIAVPASLEQLANVNTFLRRAIPAMHWHWLPQMELVAEELLVNIMNYAYGDAGGSVEVGCGLVTKEGIKYICLTVKDWGEPFNPFAEAITPDVGLTMEERPYGGLGVHLVRHLATLHEYSYANEANLVSVYFAV